MKRYSGESPSCSDRRMDPECWSCLTDEQRDIINEWYEDVRQADEEELKGAVAVWKNSYLFSAIPFAAFELARSIEKINDIGAVRALLNCALAYVGACAVILLSQRLYVQRVSPYSENKRRDSITVAVVVAVLSFLVSRYLV